MNTWKNDRRTFNRLRQTFTPARVAIDELSPRELAIYRMSRQLTDTGAHPHALGLRLKSYAIAKDIVKASASRGWDVSHALHDLADEAAGGLGLAIAQTGSHGDLPRLFTRERISHDVNRAGYRTAQRHLRKMAHTSADQLAGWHESMVYADRPDKDMLEADLDRAALRIRKAAILNRARQLIASARQACAASRNRKAVAVLRADLKRIARATRYMLSLTGNPDATWEPLRMDKNVYRDFRGMADRLGVPLPI